jgi:transcriptional regulator with XRE-family HTH domain
MSTRQIIERLGGTRALARRLGISPGTVNYWKKQKRVPAKHQADLIAAGADLDPPICAQDFFTEEAPIVRRPNAIVD